MMNVSGNQAAKQACIFARAAAAALMRQKLHAIDVGEHFPMVGHGLVFSRLIVADLVRLPLCVKAGKLGNLEPISIARSQAQPLFKRLLKNPNISVFTKNQRKNQPIITRAHLAITTSITEKSSFPPLGNIGRCPFIALCLRVKACGFVMHILGADPFSSTDGLRGFSNQNAVHNDGIANGKVPKPEFMLHRNIGNKRINLAGDRNLIARRQIHDRDRDVIVSINFQSLFSQQLKFAHNPSIVEEIWFSWRIQSANTQHPFMVWRCPAVKAAPVWRRSNGLR